MKYLFCLLILLTTFFARPVYASPTYKVPAECSKFIDEIEKYDWDTSMVLKIAKKESGCNASNHNWKDGHRPCIGSWNVMQIACLHYKKGEDIDDVKLNIKKAYQVYKEAGSRFSPWTTCKLITGCR